MFRFLLCAALSLAVSAQSSEVEYFERALQAIEFSNDTNETNETLIRPTPAPPTPAPPTGVPTAPPTAASPPADDLPTTSYDVTAPVESVEKADEAKEALMKAAKSKCVGDCTVSATNSYNVKTEATFSGAECGSITDKNAAEAAGEYVKALRL